MELMVTLVPLSSAANRSGTEFNELERDGVVTRKVFEVVPPKVEYALVPMAGLCTRCWRSCARGAIGTNDEWPDRRSSLLPGTEFVAN